MIGSEGTLGFISKATLNTIPDLPYKATALLLFPTVYDACLAIESLKNTGIAALEIMDRSALRSVEDAKEGLLLILALIIIFTKICCDLKWFIP